MPLDHISDSRDPTIFPPMGPGYFGSYKKDLTPSIEKPSGLLHVGHFSVPKDGFNKNYKKVHEWIEWQLPSQEPHP